MSWAEPLLAWLRPLMVLLVFVAIAELLLPEGQVRRYADAVLGLVVLAAVLDPVLQLLRADLPALAARYEGAVRDLASRAVPAAASPVGSPPAARAGLERDAFRALVERELERLALQVPGVARSRAEVEVAVEGPVPGVRRARLHVALAAGGGPASPAPGAAAGREGSPAPPVPPVRPVAPVGRSGGDEALGAGAGAGRVPAAVAAELRRLAWERLGIPPDRVEVVPLGEGR